MVGHANDGVIGYTQIARQLISISHFAPESAMTNRAHVRAHVRFFAPRSCNEPFLWARGPLRQPWEDN